MKATELRIGNIIKLSESNEIFMAYEICSSGFRVRNKNEDTWIEEWQFEGIELTEEWLLKFGFEKLTDKSRGFNSNSYTYTKGISFIVHLNDKLLSVNFWQGNEKKYVHELQNLFFALTGEELTI